VFGCGRKVNISRDEHVLDGLHIIPCSWIIWGGVD
jgi:hypothetical protein